ncbi:MAG: hypothetical protein E4H20_09400, partial [Spirochaetales bacterium]
PLRLVVTAGDDGLKAAQQWTELIRTLDLEFGVQLTIVAEDGEARRLLASREAEAAVLDPVSYIAHGPGLSVVAIIARNGKPYVRFSLIVPRASIYHRMIDLRYPRVAFRGLTADSARTYAFAWARSEGAFESGSSEEMALDSYDSVLRAVALGEADAGFVPSDLLADQAGSVLIERVRELGASPAVPFALLVMYDDLSPPRKRLIESLAVQLLQSGKSDFIALPDAELPLVLAAMAEALHAAPR